MEDKEIIERAAKIMKLVRLSANPMMDIVAVKLNCEPTWEEVENIRRTQLALKFAAKYGNLIDLAIEYEEAR